ncbi:ribosomal protein S9/S16-domain-containing protein, partial [Phakopsora pachyrhizi]
KRMLHVLWNPRMRWQDIKAMGDMIHGSEGRKLKMMEYREAISKLNELRSLKRYVIMVKNLDLNQNPLNELDSELDQALLRYSRPEDQASSSKDRDVGRDHLGRFYGIGKKKESTARVWMIEVKLDNSETFRKTGDDQTQETDLIQDSSERLGETDQEIKQTDADKNHLHFGKVLVNGRPISDYFNTSRLRAAALRPLEITNSIGHYNIHILTHGGGKMGQAAAVSHGLAVAMMKALTEASKTDSSIQERYFKKVLVRSSLTVRDPRVVERKKTGKPGARSSYRWVKR